MFVALNATLVDASSILVWLELSATIDGGSATAHGYGRSERNPDVDDALKLRKLLERSTRPSEVDSVCMIGQTRFITTYWRWSFAVV